ncbi:MAG: glycosyl hydrolase family 18 protein [Spirosomataceae bacterium]
MRILLLLLCCISSAWAQSIHEEQSRQYGQLPYKTEAEFDQFNGYSTTKVGPRESGVNYTLQKKVFGFNPYWVGSAYNSYDYSLLSTIAYFSYEVEPKTGAYTTIRDWKTTSLVPLAQSKGCKVVLSVTNFGTSANQTLLNNPQSRKVLIDSLVSLVKFRFANGINIDFESVPSSVRDSLSKFMGDLSVRLKATIPGAVLSIDLPAVDWNNSFDVKSLTPLVDEFLIMGYDYYYSGSTTAGPVSPLKNSQTFGNLSLTKSVDDYLAKGIPPEKLLLAVPYYGRNWATVSDQLGAATVSSISSTSKLFNVAKKEITQYGRRWNTDVMTPYYVYQNGSQWYQTWFDDAESLTAKYNLIKSKGLAGAGIWALSYDGTEPDLNIALRNAFTDSPITSIAEPTISQIEVYPNPARRSEGMVLSLPSPAQLSLIDTFGQVISTQQSQESTFHLNTELIPAGMYLLKVESQTGVFIKKVWVY